MRPDEPAAPDQPTMPDAGNPPGYGDPHPPAGGVFAAEATVLIQAADAWDGVSGQLKSAWSKVAVGWGYPTIFGFADTLFTAGQMHEQINEKVTNACADGTVITAGLADGLVETANSFSGTDATQGANFRPLQERAGS